jgi:hypothetical protein
MLLRNSAEHSHYRPCVSPKRLYPQRSHAVVTWKLGSYPCKRTSRLPHFHDTRLTDGGEVVSLTRRPPFTPRKIPGTHFCYRMSRPQGHSAAGRIR